jgi:hypothetical protein
MVGEIVDDGEHAGRDLARSPAAGLPPTIVLAENRRVSRSREASGVDPRTASVTAP